MKQKDQIIPIWQTQGKSTNQIAQEMGTKLGVKATHTGTLDPMAEGVIVVLTGEKRLMKNELSSVEKSYEFEIALGIETDTYDLMGKVLNLKETEIPDKKTIEIVCKGFKGDYSQVVPKFSAYKVRGKPIHWHTLNNSEVELPKKDGKIINLTLVNEKQEKFKLICEETISKIENVKFGDFRQKEHIKQWKKLEKENPNLMIRLLKFECTLTKGLYVRTLSQDICKKLGVTGSVYSLVRTKNGEIDRSKVAMVC